MIKATYIKTFRFNIYILNKFINKLDSLFHRILLHTRSEQKKYLMLQEIHE
jgi:hypothetical protein